MAHGLRTGGSFQLLDRGCRLPTGVAAATECCVIGVIDVEKELDIVRRRIRERSMRMSEIDERRAELERRVEDSQNEYDRRVAWMKRILNRLIGDDDE